MADPPMLKGMDELDAFRQMRDWAKLTETGDRAELTFLAGRFGAVGAAGRAAGYLHRAEVPGLQRVFPDRDARAGRTKPT